MKLSEFIKMLEEIKNKEGDLDVFICTSNPKEHPEPTKESLAVFKDDLFIGYGI